MSDKKLNKNVNMSYSSSVNAPGPSTDLSMSEAHTCTEKCEKMVVKSNGQWSLEKCWKGYKRVEGTKRYSKGSCEPVGKDEGSSEKCPECGHPDHAPIKCKDIIRGGRVAVSGSDDFGDSIDEGQIRHLAAAKRAKQIEEINQLKADTQAHIDELNERGDAGGKIRVPAKVTQKAEVAPEESNNRKTYLEAFGKSDVELSFYDNGDLEILIGEDVPAEYETNLIKALEKKEWAPKKEHKSERGGLTEAGRKSYNKATGGNLKAPQPGGGPRKRSFCARNKGQIKMHSIDCKKDPEKRACKARRRWKCTN